MQPFKTSSAAPAIPMTMALFHMMIAPSRFNAIDAGKKTSEGRSVRTCPIRNKQAVPWPACSMVDASYSLSRASQASAL
jgi:hypothetical protein